MENNPPAVKETQVSSLGQEGPLEKEMVTHSSGESHGQRSLVGYSSWGLKELDMTERLTPSLSPLKTIGQIKLDYAMVTN